MATSGVAGRWRFPVKLMQGERLEQADVTKCGLVGDRMWTRTFGRREDAVRVLIAEQL